MERVFFDYTITGKTVERELFGDVCNKCDFQQTAYLPYHWALQDARIHQPWDPTDPQPRFANDVHATIAEHFSPLDYSRVCMYTAIRSSLDHHHGVDAFVECHDNSGTTWRVTLDVTTNPQKIHQACKADVVFLVPRDGLDPRFDRELFAETVNDIAWDVIRKIEAQMQPNAA